MNVIVEREKGLLELEQKLSAKSDHAEKENERLRVKELAEKNYKELKDATAELVELSNQLNQEVLESNERVVSARIFDRLDKIDKLTKQIRSKARSGD